MKSDRKRLKAEKADLVNQMQQLYATLESREEQLRDFIRNYEQHRKVSTLVRPLLLKETQVPDLCCEHKQQFHPDFQSSWILCLRVTRVSVLGEWGRGEGAGQRERSAGKGEVGPASADQGGHGAHGNVALAARPQGKPHQGAGGWVGHGETDLQSKRMLMFHLDGYCFTLFSNLSSLFRIVWMI